MDIKVLALCNLGLFLPELRKTGLNVLAIVPLGRAQHVDDREYDLFGHPEGAATFLKILCDGFNPDIVFQDDDSTPSIHWGLENSSIPRVWYSIDSHLHAWHKHYSALFDFVFFAQKNLAVEFAHFQPQCEWLPLFFTGEEVEWRPWSQRKRDAVFIGSLNVKLNPARVELIHQLQESLPTFEALQNVSVNIYLESKVAINQSARNDLNFRFFEVTGFGALLITDFIHHSLSDILIPGEDFLIYRKSDDLIEKINWALQNTEQAEAMAKRAFEKIKQKHMIHHRMETLIHRLKVIAEKAFPRKVLPKENHFKLSQLAFSYALCGLLNLPPNLSNYFQQQANLVIEKIPENFSPQWALLAQGLGLFNQKSFSQALKIFNELFGSAKDKWLLAYAKNFKQASEEALEDIK